MTARVVDNTGPALAVTSPGMIRGTKTINATATDATGVAAAGVTLQYSLAGANSWTTICTDASSPYSCSWNTAGRTEGAYDIRATASDTLGNQSTSAIVSAYVNNTGPTGTDVQGTNGNVNDKLDAGDTVVFTYSAAITPASILAGWSGAAPAAMRVRVNNNGNADSMEFYDAANSTPLGLLATGTTLAININYVTGPTVFNATISALRLDVHGHDRVADLGGRDHEREGQDPDGLADELAGDEPGDGHPRVPEHGHRDGRERQRLLMARRLPQLTRGSMALALNALLGLLALGLAFAPPGEGAPQLQLASASGALSLSNSKEGAAIFRAVAMRPGEEASGSVTITNTGTVTGALTLAPAAPADTPGQGGGTLSDKLELLVIDVTTVSVPVTVYAGTLTRWIRPTSARCCPASTGPTCSWPR